jgi:hypothetical protein
MAPASARRYEGHMIANSCRVLFTACALTALAACAQSNSSAELSAAPPPPEPQAAEAPPPASAPPSRTKSAAAPAGRASQGAPAAPPPPPARQAALTPEEVKAQCWMKYENDKHVKNIDDRLKLVEKCVDDTSRNQPPPPRQ